MKYDCFEKFRKHLNDTYVKTTADKYFFAVKGILAPINFTEPEEIPLDVLESQLYKAKTKSDFSAAKRGIIEFKKCFPDLVIPDSKFFADGSASKRKYPKKRRTKPLALDTTTRKINAIRDKKLKLAYRLMLASGARVSEVAALRAEDITITDGSIRVHIENGKGGKSRDIDALRDEYLSNELARYKESHETGNNLFYSASHMKQEAGRLGFECHDLRRTFAQIYRNEKIMQYSDTYKANGETMKAMGHTRYRTLRIYLKRKIDFGGKKNV